jgi:hypothetical protein
VKHLSSARAKFPEQHVLFVTDQVLLEWLRQLGDYLAAQCQIAENQRAVVGRAHAPAPAESIANRRSTKPRAKHLSHATLERITARRREIGAANHHRVWPRRKDREGAREKVGNHGYVVVEKIDYLTGCSCERTIASRCGRGPLNFNDVKPRISRREGFEQLAGRRFVAVADYDDFRVPRQVRFKNAREALRELAETSVGYDDDTYG